MAQYSVWKHKYDDEWILSHWQGKCTTEFCDRYVSETGHEVSKDTLRKHINRVLKMESSYHYADKEISYVKDHYAELGAVACAERLGISINRVYGIAHVRLGLKMTKEDFKRHVNVYESRYPSGTIRHQGKRNCVIKTESGWHELGRYVWEQHYGEIPDGYYVVFLNRNAEDARIENLAIVPKGVVGAMNLNGLWHEDADLTKTQLLVLLLERVVRRK